MQNPTKQFYRQELHNSYHTTLRLFGVCVVLLLGSLVGGLLYFVTVSEMQPIQKTCGSFTDYGELQAWLKDNPKDFDRLNDYGRGKYPNTPCDTLYGKQ